MENEFYNLLAEVLGDFKLVEVDDWAECPFCKRSYWDKEDTCNNPHCLGVRIHTALEKFEKNFAGKEYYTIRVKRHPHLFVGKESSSYAINCDEGIIVSAKHRPGANIDEILQLNAYWFKPERFAKIWTSLPTLRRFLRYCASEYEHPTFSEYELLLNGKVIPMPIF